MCPSGLEALLVIDWLVAWFQIRTESSPKPLCLARVGVGWAALSCVCCEPTINYQPTQRGAGGLGKFSLPLGYTFLTVDAFFSSKLKKKSGKNPSKKLDGLWIHAPFVDSDWLGWCGASCPGCPGSSDPSGWSAGWSCGPWSSGPWTRRASGPWHPGLAGGRWAPSPNNVLQGVEPWQCKQYKVDYHFRGKMSQLFLLLIHFVFVKSDSDISHPYCFAEERPS